MACQSNKKMKRKAGQMESPAVSSETNSVREAESERKIRE